MKLYFVKTHPFIKRFFNTQIWDIPNTENTVYLTFDDGPIPEITPWVLEILEKYNIKATFFCIGDNVSKHPEIYNQILENGHKTANHTFNHLNGWKTKNNIYITNTLKCADVLQDQSNKLFRPPYGKISRLQSEQLINLGYKIIMWDVLSADFDTTITPEECLQNVILNTESGSIIVFHDSIKASKNLKFALPKAIEILKSRGFNFSVL